MRKPRRVFASSFVITVATVAAADPAEHRWRVEQHGASCSAVELKTKAAKPYACPEDAQLPLVVVKPAGSTECFADQGKVCDHCNPPPPRKLRCP